MASLACNLHAPCSRGLAARPLRGARMTAKRGSLIIANATHKITVLPGDGIGPEIMDVALKVLIEAGKAEGESFLYTEALIGGSAIDATGDPYPKETEELCKASDAVLLAAIGG